MPTLPPDAIDSSWPGGPGGPTGEAVRAADEWLERHEQHQQGRDHRAELARLTGDAAALRDRIARIGQALAAAPGQRAELEATQRRLLDELERALGQVGELTLDWMARGHQVVLADAPTAPAADASVAAVEPVVASTGHEQPVPLEPEPEPAPAPVVAPEAPAPALVVAPRVSLVPIGSVDVMALRRDVRQVWPREESSEPAPAEVEWHPTELARLLDQLGPPRPLAAEEVGGEVDRLDAAVDDNTFLVWRRLPARVQRQLISLCTTRARQIQDRVTGSDGMRLSTLFSMLTRFSASEQPGYVNGLSRSHSPKGATWLDDARVAWGALRDELPEDEPEERPNPQVALGELKALLGRAEIADDEAVAAMAKVLDAGLAPDDVRLVDLVAPRQAALQAALGKLGRFKRLRRALRERADEGEAGEADAEVDGPVPADWALWGVTRGRHAALVGGDQREESRQRIERAFELASLEWIGSDHVRVVQALATSVRSGGVDLVLLLRRFISHEIERIVASACDEAKIPCVVVDKGYGVTQIRLALEKMPPSVRPAATG